MPTGTALPLSVNYNSKHQLRAFLEEQGLGMRKKFGQNFMINPAVRNMLLDSLELPPGAEVWEVGPGLGAMTAGLLERGAKVTAFEIDPAFSRYLREAFAGQAFSLIEGDVLKTWPTAFSNNGASSGNELFLFGNLPYNIGAALIGDLIEKGRTFKRLVVTVQREVALRMAAKPASKDYSSFSVLCSSVYKVSLLSLIKSSSFYPAPRVDSQGVRLDLLADREKLPPLFYPLLRALFSSRRKTIRNTLSNFASSLIINTSHGETSPRELAEQVFERAGINGERRPETLDVNDFAALANFLEEILSHG